MSKKERDFIDKFKEKVYQKYRKTFFYKIPDGFRTGSKPFDVILDNGKTHYLEFKWLNENRKSFKVSSIFQSHQIRILNQLFTNKNKNYLCAWGVIKVGRDTFLLPACELQNERINLAEFKPFTLDEVVNYLCSNE